MQGKRNACSQAIKAHLAGVYSNEGVSALHGAKEDVSAAPSDAAPQIIGHQAPSIPPSSPVPPYYAHHFPGWPLLAAARCIFIVLPWSHLYRACKPALNLLPTMHMTLYRMLTVLQVAPQTMPYIATSSSLLHLHYIDRQ